MPDALPGQHIVVKLRTAPGATPVTRNYSLCGPAGEGTYLIGVKREEFGAGSAYMHDRVRIGHLVAVSAPRGTFVLAEGPNPVVLISAGIGITPMLAMLHHAASTWTSSPRETWWLHSARDGAHHPFARRTRGLAVAIPVKRSLVAFSRARPLDRLGVDYDVAGRVDGALFATLGLPLEADYYLCGPSAFLEGVSSGLRALEIPDKNIHSETFGGAVARPSSDGSRPTPHPPAGAPGSGPMVTFAKSGLSVPWNEKFGTLLEFAEACDVPVKWSCRSGVCHACETGLTEGDLEYSPDPIDRPSEGVALLCCSKPTSETQFDI